MKKLFLLVFLVVLIFGAIIFLYQPKAEIVSIDLSMFQNEGEGWCVIQRTILGGKNCHLFIQPPYGYSFLLSGKDDDGDPYIVWTTQVLGVTEEWGIGGELIIEGTLYHVVSIQSTQ